MSVVIDASLSVAWCFEDENTPVISGIMAGVARDGGHVPANWRIEVANAFVMGKRRGRITAETSMRSISLLDAFDLVEHRTDLRAWRRTFELAETHRLTAYDACYLELAMRLGTPLASLDADLRHAASSAGVETVGI